MTCSQCGKERQQTASGICKPCAMKNAKEAKKNGKAPLFGSEEHKINAQSAPSAEQHFIHRHGPIHGKKLG
jgi:hypothetical protein